MTTPPHCGVFAWELERVLMPYGYALDDLRRAPFALRPRNVDRLIQSLQGIKVLAALSHEDLQTIVIEIHTLTSEERLRLYAALIALGTQRLLLEYLSDARAWEITDEVRQSAFAWLKGHGSEDDVLRQHVSEPTLSPLTVDADAALFTEALDAYDEALALQAVALSMQHGKKMLTRAQAILTYATQTLAESPTENGQQSAWQDWHHEFTLRTEAIEELLA
jgi:hypothetical protein